ncbi:MAG: hypothetical protein ACRDBX_02575 [Erysipelotrichaceae bacterium]
MKSAIFSCMLVILMGLVSWIWLTIQTYDHEVQQLSSALKRSIAYTMMETHEQLFSEQELMDVFESHFRLLASPRYHYELDMMGYLQTPRLLRIRAKAMEKNSRNPLHFTLDEVVIEEVYNENHP